MHKLIINADDFGLSRGVNAGIVDAFNLGILTSTTLMTGMQAYENAILLAKQNPNLGIGVHLTLTAGNSILNTHQVIAENGVFKHINPEQTDQIHFDEQEVYRELAAQIEKVLASGINVTHLDGHHHVQKQDGVREIVETLAKKYQLPIRWSEKNANKMASEVVHPEYLELRFDEKISDFINGKLNETMLNAYFKEVIARVKEHHITEIMTHPAYIDRFLLENSSMTTERVYEADLLIRSTFVDEIKNDVNIQLVNYHEAFRK